MDYWAALATLAAHELAEAEKRDELDRLHLQGVHVSEEAVRREAGLHPAVERDIEGMLSGGGRGRLLAAGCCVVVLAVQRSAIGCVTAVV